MREKNLNDTELRKIFRMLYCIVLMIPFFWQLPILLGLSVAFPIQDTFRPLVLTVGAMAVTGLWMTGRKRSLRLTPDAWILLLAFGWMIVVFLLHRKLLDEAVPVLQRAGWSWLIFYPFAFLLEEDECIKSLRLLALCWTAVMTLLSIIGLACAVMGVGLENLSGALSFGMLEHRLQLGIWATSTSENILTGWLLAAAGLCLSPKRWQRSLYGISMAILFLAMALTDGRNGILSIGISVGAAAFVVLWNRFEKKKILGFCVGGAVAVLCVFLVYAGSIQLQKGFSGTYHQVMSMREAVIAPFLRETPETAEQTAPVEETIAQTTAEEEIPDTAQAQAPADADTQIHRKIEASLNGRSAIWGDALRALRSNEDSILLIGRPGSSYLETFRKSPSVFVWAEHLHNIFLQVIVEYGIPGELLVLAFLLIFAFFGWKLIFAGNLALWKRLLPVPAIVLLASELVDAFTRFGQDNVARYVLFLFIGLSVHYGRHTR